MSLTTQDSQTEFNKKYITSAEIVKDLNVSRSTILHARERGLLPNAINVNNGQFYIWDRETIRPYLDAWRLILNVRRGA